MANSTTKRRRPGAAKPPRVSRDARRERFELRLLRRFSLFRAVNLIAVTAVVLTLGGALAERLVEPETFGSFGAACWWAIVTVSTTGFGDVVPHTAAGKAVASVVMIAALAWVPAVTAMAITLHLRSHDAKRRPAHAALEEELVRRLDRLERALAELQDRQWAS